MERWSLRGGAVLLAAGMLWGADAPPGPVTAKTGDVEIVARLITEKDAQVQVVGADLQREYVIVDLTITPRGRYPVTLSRDDFLLRSERDNERATADSPDRIAGSAVLVLGAEASRRPVYSESGDPVYIGGLPGTGGGLPRRVGADSPSVGSGSANSGPSKVTASSAKASPLLEALRAKELPLGETRQKVTGYLYFPVDPKQKHKNFHLHYKGPNEAADLRFR